MGAQPDGRDSGFWQRQWDLKTETMQTVQVRPEMFLQPEELTKLYSFRGSFGADQPGLNESRTALAMPGFVAPIVPSVNRDNNF